MVRDGRTGVLTTHDDAALAAAIGSLLDDPVRAEAMGAAGRDHFDDVYDARITTRQLLDVLTEARDGHTAAVAA
jgi:hypothetical protein